VCIFKKGLKINLFVVCIFMILGLFDNAFAEDIILNDLKGQAVNLSSAKNKPAILFFWTTWCSYCRKEIKGLNQLYLEMKKEGIALFAVNIGESDYKVQRFFKDYVLNFNVLLDKEGKLADQYDVIGVPTYILLDKSGHRVARENTLPSDYRNLLLK